VLDEWAARHQRDSASAEAHEQRNEAARQVTICERSIRRLVDAYEAGALELDELKRRSDALKARLGRAREDVATADRTLRETVELRAVVTRIDDFAKRR
jgi:chromosome segregation ATPase